MDLKNTFVRVSPDCPVTSSVIPVGKNGSSPIHVLQYELLSEHPYRYTLQDLIYEVHIRHKAIEDAEARKDEIWSELFQKSHPCMRASMLPKKYGWGVHYDEEGRIALYSMESEEYQQFTASGQSDVNVFPAMRNTRK